MDEIAHVNIITCKVLGKYIADFKIESDSSANPTMAKPAITACKRDGYFAFNFKLGNFIVHSICISLDADMSTIPEHDTSVRKGIPKEIKQRYFETLRTKKLKLIREKIAQKI